MLSLERNYILVKTYMIGGPSERVVPPRKFHDDDKVESFKYPLFSQYPPPKEYIPQISARTAMKQGIVDAALILVVFPIIILVLTLRPLIRYETWNV